MTRELFQARARLELREECREQDAREVVEIMKYRFVILAAVTLSKYNRLLISPQRG